MSKFYYIVTGLVLLISIITVIDGTVISGTDLSLASSGSSGTVDIILDQAPSGLAGYQLNISFSKDGVADVQTVSFPAAFSMNSASSLPSSSASIVAVDLLDQIKSGASDVTLATLGIKGISDGASDLKIDVIELTDDSGNSIPGNTEASHVTVGKVIETPAVKPTVPVSPGTPVISPNKTPIKPEPIPPIAIPTTIPPTPMASQAPEPVDEFLKAEFTAMPQTGTPPLTVNFSDYSTGNPKKWEWNFGDGTMSKSKNPVHVYGGIGRYTVTLKVSNANNSATESRKELIRVVGDYPTGPSGFAMVTSNPSGAEVYTDNRYLGTTPANLVVPAGSKSLIYTKEGFLNKTVQVTIRPGEIKLIPCVNLKNIPK